ncbi:hypothetical protein BOVAB4_1867 [Bacteroides ovatus]|nr:hypothetical protein BOVA115_2108 [Bacteroides ovatus]CAG9910874.1 hypothetical protein BOVAB4_1867 [Bacteroides ovatus]
MRSKLYKAKGSLQFDSRDPFCKLGGDIFCNLPMAERF